MAFFKRSGKSEGRKKRGGLTIRTKREIYRGGEGKETCAGDRVFERNTEAK